MLLGRVVGTVVATRKEPELEGLKLLLVRAADVDGKPTGGLVVAIDAVGAGLGEVVLTRPPGAPGRSRPSGARPAHAAGSRGGPRPPAS